MATENNETIVEESNTEAEVPQNDPEPSQKTFTQEQVSKMMAKEKREGKNAILKQLGFDDVKTAETAIKQYQEYLDAQKTDLQRAEEKMQQYNNTLVETQKRAELAETKIIALSKGINPQYLEDAIVIAQTRATEEKTVDMILDEMKDTHSIFFVESTQQGTGTLPKPHTAQKTMQEVDKKAEIGKELAERRKAQMGQIKSNPYIKTLEE